MRVLVNALSASSLSGQHVLRGHLRQLAEWSRGQHEFLVLCPPGVVPAPEVWAPQDHVIWQECPSWSSRWLGRAAREWRYVSRCARDWSANVLLTASGMLTSGCPLPQVVMANNPWCLAPKVPSGTGQRVKAAIQRHAYRKAVGRAALMAYISRFLQEAYERNSGAPARASVVAYTAVDDDTHAAAARMAHTSRGPYRVLCVSAMAPWKNIHTLVRAVASVQQQDRIPVELTLVGPWCDRKYERRVRAEIDGLGLNPTVRIEGHVSRESLHRHYAEAAVFALLSRCESFGIPALEAQAFGTPSLIGEGTAMGEICGRGAVAVSPHDPQAAGAALTRLLTEPAHWQATSAAARTNAARFRWSECSRPLLKMFDLA